MEYKEYTGREIHKNTEPVYFKVPILDDETVRAEMWDLQYFYDPIHYHEECQITFILESDGILFIGDKLSQFQSGELFIIGKNIPHVFRHDKSYYQDGTKQHARAISIFFNTESIQSIINGLPESSSMDKFMENSKFGYKLEKMKAVEVEENVRKIINNKGMDRVIELLALLNKISKHKDLESLMTISPVILDPEEGKKLDKVFTYLMESYQEKITLDQVASLINFTPSAFCRYFKNHTQKTFSRFLIEVRIGKACKMLQKGSNVTEACYSSGYNNISNFHRHFKQITGFTPNEYKKKILNVN